VLLPLLRHPLLLPAASTDHPSRQQTLQTQPPYLSCQACGNNRDRKHPHRRNIKLNNSLSTLTTDDGGTFTSCHGGVTRRAPRAA
jgi:hypothetical protein